MAPTSRIYLTRHAQAEHVRVRLTQNVEDDYSIHDAPLTELGKRQASRLPALTPELQETVEVILSSPLRRTLQTVSLGYSDALKRLGGPGQVVCLPELQGRSRADLECNDVPCDTGSDRAVLERLPEFASFNLSKLTPEWNSKQGFFGTATR